MNAYAALSRTLLCGAAIVTFNLAANTATAAEPENNACRVTLQSSRTEFPAASQHLGESGAVQVRVQVAADGKVRDATLLESSGYAQLDSAALRSIQKFWRFDTAHCSAKDLERSQIVAVTFERAKTTTVSGTVDGRSIAKAKALRANSHCSATEDGAGTIFACVDQGSQSNAVASVASNTK